LHHGFEVDFLNASIVLRAHVGIFYPEGEAFAVSLLAESGCWLLRGVFAVLCCSGLCASSRLRPADGQVRMMSFPPDWLVHRDTPRDGAAPIVADDNGLALPESLPASAITAGYVADQEAHCIVVTPFGLSLRL